MSNQLAVAEPRPYDAPYRAERPAFAWLLEREVLRFLKIWYFTVAGHVMSALLFVVVFGFALGGHISGVNGVPYDQFILPGLAGQAVINVGYINGTPACSMLAATAISTTCWPAHCAGGSSTSPW